MSVKRSSCVEYSTQKELFLDEVKGKLPLETVFPYLPLREKGLALATFVDSLAFPGGSLETGSPRGLRYTGVLGTEPRSPTVGALNL